MPSQHTFARQAGPHRKLHFDFVFLSEEPVRHGARNRETMLGQQHPRDRFEKRFDPTNYSCDWGPMHDVVLDGMEPIPDQLNWQAVRG